MFWTCANMPCFAPHPGMLAHFGRGHRNGRAGSWTGGPGFGWTSPDNNRDMTQAYPCRWQHHCKEEGGRASGLRRPGGRGFRSPHGGATAVTARREGWAPEGGRGSVVGRPSTLGGGRASVDNWPHSSCGGGRAADMMACLDSGYMASKRSPTGSKARTRMHAHTQRGEHTTHVSRIHAPRPPAASPR